MTGPEDSWDAPSADDSTEVPPWPQDGAASEELDPTGPPEGTRDDDPTEAGGDGDLPDTVPSDAPDGDDTDPVTPGDPPPTDPTRGDPWGTDEVLAALHAPDWLVPDLLPSPGTAADALVDAPPGLPELSDWVHRTWQATAAQSADADPSRPATVLDQLHAIVAHSTDDDVTEATLAVLRMSYFA